MNDTMKQEQIILTNAISFLNRCQLEGKESDAHVECKAYLANKVKELDAMKTPMLAKVEK